jgi:WD40 repeat protein
MTFDGFISYSHAADGRLAPAVQRGLHRLAKPWHRRRALWIFRDQTGLSVTPGLWSSIQTAMDGSKYFVLLASVEAAKSPWVNREIEHWIATKSADRILPVVTDGEWIWDEATGDFTEDSTAVPSALRKVFLEEPFFLDLRWARGSEHLSLQHSRFRDAIAQLAAPMHGVSKDDLEGEDVRQHRHARRLRFGATVTLVVLTLLAAVTGVSAVRNADRARDAAAEALRQEKAANSQRDMATRSAAEAQRQQGLAEQQQTRAERARAAAERLERAARQAERAAAQQRRAADRAAAEASRQRRLADQATTRKQEQERLAREAAERAKQAEAEAERLAAIAAEQRRLADEAAAEAARQQHLADQAAAEAAKQQRVAVSRRLMNQSGAALADDPRTALMLGAAAQSLNPDTTTKRELAGALAATAFTGALDHTRAAVHGPDGTLVTVGEDGRVALWNVSDPREPVRVATLADRAQSLAASSLKLSADGRTLAIVDARFRVVLWDVADRAHPARLATLTGSDAAASALAISANGGIVVIGEFSGTTVVWDTSDRARPVQLSKMTKLGSAAVNAIALSPDGRLLIVNQGPFVHYDLTDPAHPVSLPALITDDWAPLAFSRDGTTLAVGSRSGSVSLYDVTHYPPVPTDKSPSHPPRASDIYYPDRTDASTAAISSLAFSPDGKLLVAGDVSGRARIWNRSAPGIVPPIAGVQAHGSVSDVSIDPRNGTLVTVDNSVTATLWNVVPTGTPDRLAKLTVTRQQNRATSFSRDGNSLVAVDAAGTANTWNTTVPAHPVRGTARTLSSSGVRTVAFSPDHRAVAALTAESRTLTVADMSKPSRTTTLATLTGAKSDNPMAFSPDGKTLAVVAGTTSLMLWNVADRSRPTLLAQPAGDFGRAVAFSPDGKTLAVAAFGGSAITLWNVADRAVPAQLATLSGHKVWDWVESLAFSPDGRTLASGDAGGRAMLWDVTDRARPERVATLTANNHWVYSVAFSPDGRTLAVGGGTYTATLWDTTIPSAPIRLATVRTEPNESVSSVEFRSDGRTLAVTGQLAPAEPRGPAEPTVTLWNYAALNSLRADPAKYACAVTGRGLTATEWARYIPEIKYRRTC